MPPVAHSCASPSPTPTTPTRTYLAGDDERHGGLRCVVLALPHEQVPADPLNPPSGRSRWLLGARAIDGRVVNGWRVSGSAAGFVDGCVWQCILRVKALDKSRARTGCEGESQISISTQAARKRLQGRQEGAKRRLERGSGEKSRRLGRSSINPKDGVEKQQGRDIGTLCAQQPPPLHLSSKVKGRVACLKPSRSCAGAGAGAATRRRRGGAGS